MDDLGQEGGGHEQTKPDNDHRCLDTVNLGGSSGVPGSGDAYGATNRTVLAGVTQGVTRVRPDFGCHLNGSECSMAEDMTKSARSNQSPAPTGRPSKRWYLVAVLAVGVAVYALFVLVARSYPPPLEDSLNSRPWGIYPHAFFALFGLAIGPWQFRGAGLRRRGKHHRTLGKVYVVAAFGTAVTGFYMSFYAHGPALNRLGFGVLAVALFLTTAVALAKIRGGHILAHRAWMLRSYALMFAAVTLRLWLPVLIAVNRGDFDAAYQTLGWLAWVPNLVWAEWHLARTETRVS